MYDYIENNVIESDYSKLNQVVNFSNEVDEIVSKLNELDLIQKVDVYCTVCKKTLPLFIKKSIMKSATSFPVPIVYNHQGHAIVCYIDQNFIVRGVELVNITG